MIGGWLGSLSVGRRVAVGGAGEGSPAEPGVICIVGVAVRNGSSGVVSGVYGVGDGSSGVGHGRIDTPAERAVAIVDARRPAECARVAMAVAADASGADAVVVVETGDPLRRTARRTPVWCPRTPRRPQLKRAVAALTIAGAAAAGPRCGSLPHAGCLTHVPPGQSQSKPSSSPPSHTPSTTMHDASVHGGSAVVCWRR